MAHALFVHGFYHTLAEDVCERLLLSVRSWHNYNGGIAGAFFDDEMENGVL